MSRVQIKMIMPHRFRLKHVPLAIALFFIACIVFGLARRALRQTRCKPSAGCMQDFSYCLVLPGGQHVTIWAQKMSVTPQRLGKTVFRLFREVDLSNVKVTIGGGDPSCILDWATFETLTPLAAFMLPDMLQQDKLYLAGTKIVLQNLEVSVYPHNGHDCAARIRADSLCLDAISGQAVFTGRFDLKINRSEHVCSTKGGIWSPSEKIIRFPHGFSENGRSANNRLFSLALVGAGREDAKLAKTFKGGLGKAFQRMQLKLATLSGSGKTTPKRRHFGIKAFFKHIKSMNREKLMNFFWRYLALNPGAFARNKLSPGRLLMPGFKLGSFNPGPFYGSTGSAPKTKTDFWPQKRKGQPNKSLRNAQVKSPGKNCQRSPDGASSPASKGQSHYRCLPGSAQSRTGLPVSGPRAATEK